jgi:hypothetical protein
MNDFDCFANRRRNEYRQRDQSHEELPRDKSFKIIVDRDLRRPTPEITSFYSCNFLKI